MSKRSKEIDETVSDVPMIQPDAEISPERVKKIRHFTNYAKTPYISKQGTFKPEITVMVLLKANHEDIEEIFQWVFMEKPGDIEAARTRLITLVKDGN